MRGIKIHLPRPFLRRSRRIWSLVVVAICVTGAALATILAAPAHGAASSVNPPTAGWVRYDGSVPQNQCTPKWVPGIYYGQDGYVVTAECSRLADFTEARSVSTFPFESDTIATQWFTTLNKKYESPWQIQNPIYHPSDAAKMQYRGTGENRINLYLTRYTLIQDNAIWTATLPPDATGSVVFYTLKSGQPAELGTAHVSNGQAKLTPSNATLGLGTHTMWAVYTGDSKYPAVRTPDAEFHITKASNSPKLSTTTPNVPLGQSPTLIATLPATATGQVTFVEWRAGVGHNVGQAPLVNGRAALSTLTLPEGAQTFTASYSGDDYNNSASSAPLTINTYAVKLSVANPNITLGEPLVATATLPASATGQVQFRLAVGQGWTAFPSVPLVNGSAEFSRSTANFSRGTFRVYAYYQGSSIYPAVLSPPVTITIS